VKDPPKIFWGKKTQNSGTFLAAHPQMAAPAPLSNATDNRKIETLKQQCIMGMFSLCSGEIWWKSRKN